jgi:hypothetical protein
MQYILEVYTLGICCDWVRDTPNLKHVFLHENFLHMLLTFGATNCKQVNEYIKKINQMAKKKKSFSLLPFQNGSYSFQILCHIIFNQMHYMNIAKHRCMDYLSMKKSLNQLHYLIQFFYSYKMKIIVKTRIQII